VFVMACLFQKGVRAKKVSEQLLGTWRETPHGLRLPHPLLCFAEGGHRFAKHADTHHPLPILHRFFGYCPMWFHRAPFEPHAAARDIFGGEIPLGFGGEGRAEVGVSSFLKERDLGGNGVGGGVQGA